MRSASSLAQALGITAALALFGCGAGDSSGNQAEGVTTGATGGAAGRGTGGAGVAGSSGGGSGGATVGGTGGTTAAPGPLCGDGQGTSLRLVVTSGGGFVEETYGFTNPYGSSYLLVDGECRYWAGRDFREGMRTGTLDAATVAELASDIGWSRLVDWDSHTDESCPDAGATIITDGVSSAECSCGCDDDAPAGLADAMDAFGSWVDQLVMAGAPTDDAVSVLAWAWLEPPAASVYAWPLASDLATLAVDEVTWDATGVLVSAPEDATLLRDLREQAFQATAYADASVCVETESGARYHLLVRDEPPRAIADEFPTFVTGG